MYEYVCAHAGAGTLFRSSVINDEPDNQKNREAKAPVRAASDVLRTPLLVCVLYSRQRQNRGQGRGVALHHIVSVAGWPSRSMSVLVRTIYGATSKTARGCTPYSRARTQYGVVLQADKADQLRHGTSSSSYAALVPRFLEEGRRHNIYPWLSGWLCGVDPRYRIFTFVQGRW